MNLRFAFSASVFLLVIHLLGGAGALADGPQDNLPDQVRHVPPPGIAVPAEDAAALRAGLEELGAKIEELRNSKEHRETILAYLSDVEVCHRSVQDALDYGEFFKSAEVDFAKSLLSIGVERATALAKGETPWTRESGTVIRGYRSKIDDSVQPYGLEIPATYDFDAPSPTRLDFWFHGRGETLGEVAFLMQRSKGQGGKITPADTIVFHPYGRYSNANKFAGEVDTFEALDNARRDYRIDPDRILVRGFSMGGAACWQFAVHHPGLWAAAQPGAGFSETPDFLKTFQGETLNAPWYEQKLWRCYDATHWALNLANLPTIAYSGEIDRQKQAADQMVAACEKEDLNLLHLIGPQTAHALHPESLREIETRLASIAAAGRDRTPATVRFVTHTLRYDRSKWVKVDRLTEHWEPGRIEAKIASPNRVDVATNGIEGFTLEFESGTCPIDLLVNPKVVVNGSVVGRVPRPLSDRSWSVSIERSADGTWRIAEASSEESLRKKHGLQGPIDDAFMDAFVHVGPTGKARYDRIAEWTIAEQARAIREWRRQFRGNARVTDDAGLSEDQVKTANLILWGDPSSNSVIARIIDRLPLKWSDETLEVAGMKFDPTHHTLAMIHPNPLNPDRYVVLNSGFTWREYSYLNNARQTPKLPDWAVIDLSTPPSTQTPGKIVAAGFFDEAWQVKKQPED